MASAGLTSSWAATAGPGEHHQVVVGGVLGAVGEDDPAAHAVPEHDLGQPRVLPVGDADQRGEVVGVLGDVLDVDPLAAGAAVTAVIERVGDQAGLAEPLRDVVVAAGVLAEPVGEHDHASWAGVRGPGVVDDADAADTVEGALGPGGGHQSSVATRVGGPA